MSQMPKVLHISADYPDANRAETTHAVRNFITSNKELDYFVVSLNRVVNPLKCNCIEGDDKGDKRVISMRYWGMPYGVLLALSMLIVAVRIRWQLKQRGIRVDVIHAHKLTFEGLAAWFLARWLSVPLVLSVRGEAESKILRFKPHYKWLIKRMLRDAVQVLYVSAWFKPILNRHFDISPHKQSLLPNFVKEKGATYSDEYKPDHLVTILDLNVFPKKGLDRLLPAFKRALTRYPNAKLDVIGRGSVQVISEVESIIKHLELQDSVVLKGTFDNTELLKLIPRYAGLALPSHNETFGMVYVEALLCGIPILYSQNTGIDGFVDWIPAKVGVDATSVDSVADGLEAILDNQYNYRQWLKENHEVIQFSFDRESYLATYNKFIRKFLVCTH
ncbi:glycosyltransferase [Methylotenera mobilis]|uniref:Glycosyl transferase group 1 n=1 Tax=Methylotenera mobilis (strain JLW8 / ATCC BAA-1282 / DSM 17540) TaxID=583345 RepID=C6WXP2_METML|nr:glycosyltransferase [Methylotenera mobilis]ACT48691.1 glycosyl transferase group 1 [Methylotenera mobilis JLW8]